MIKWIPEAPDHVNSKAGQMERSGQSGENYCEKHVIRMTLCELMQKNRVFFKLHKGFKKIAADVAKTEPVVFFATLGGNFFNPLLSLNKIPIFCMSTHSVTLIAGFSQYSPPPDWPDRSICSALLFTWSGLDPPFPILEQNPDPTGLEIPALGWLKIEEHLWPPLMDFPFFKAFRFTRSKILNQALAFLHIASHTTGKYPCLCPASVWHATQALTPLLLLVFVLLRLVLPTAVMAALIFFFE